MKYLIPPMLVVALALTGCSDDDDGDGDGNGTERVTLSGLVATGAPLANTPVYIYSGTTFVGQTTTNSSGQFTQEVNATNAAITVVAGSLISLPLTGAGTRAYANVNPITTMAAQAGAGQTDLSVEAVIAALATVSPQQIAALQAQLITNLSQLFPGPSYGINWSDITDLGTLVFVANSTGFDAVLDDATVTVSGSTLTLTNTNTGATLTVVIPTAPGQVPTFNLNTGVSATYNAWSYDSATTTAGQVALNVIGSQLTITGSPTQGRTLNASVTLGQGGVFQFGTTGTVLTGFSTISSNEDNPLLPAVGELCTGAGANRISTDVILEGDATRITEVSALANRTFNSYYRDCYYGGVENPGALSIEFDGDGNLNGSFTPNGGELVQTTASATLMARVLDGTVEDIFEGAGRQPTSIAAYSYTGLSGTEYVLVEHGNGYVAFWSSL